MLYTKLKINTQNYLKQDKSTDQTRNTHSNTMKYGKQKNNRYTYRFLFPDS